MVLSFPVVFASEIESCIVASENFECSSCNVYELENSKLVCAPKDSGLIKNPSMQVEKINGNTVRIDLWKDQGVAQFTLTTVNDNGMDKPKLDVFIDAKKVSRIPYYIDAQVNSWPIYFMLTTVFAIFVVIALILKDLSSPHRVIYHKKHSRFKKFFEKLSN